VVETLPVQERLQCPLGEDGTSYQFLSLPYTQERFADIRLRMPEVSPLNYTIYHNPTLDFYWQSNVIDASQFDASADAEHSFHSQPDLPTFTHITEEAIMIRLMFGQKTPLKVYDFGMGDGTWLKIMSAYGMESHGYDVSAYSETVANRCGIGFAPLSEYPDNSFDVIASREVFEHLVDPLSFAKLIAKKLKPGGLCILATPHKQNIRETLQRLKAGDFTESKDFDRNLDIMAPMQHINHFSPTAMIAMTKMAGLVVKKLRLRDLFASTTGFYSWRQINRAVYNPIKRYQAKSCLKFFTKAS